jgi:pimeloyl-ACP methyl ester carboxylesterase
MPRFIALLMLVACAATLPAVAQEPAKIGVVVMHGKGGNPASYVGPLAAALEGRGLLVANLEMPWSGARNYDADVAAAEKQVQEALDGLRMKGAAKLFVAGHSQGGIFALYLGGRLALDGVVAIAPGGHVGGDVFRQKLGASLEEAKKYVAEGKGGARQRLLDFEGSRGAYPVNAVPSAYVAWFDPEGAMNEFRAAKALKASVPVLFVAPANDYPALQRLKDPVFSALPRNPHTRLYQPSTDHLHAPAASSEEIVKWTREVAGAGP